MRDTKKIYENAMLEVCFNKLKSLRNSWTYEKMINLDLQLL